ncbi:MAG TPA: Uma2 family endonuclease [Thermodesulfovibrionia bacterium]|nr:Uma2 family endonuclease [Thermodesulfovibrionia bacterium]
MIATLTDPRTVMPFTIDPNKTYTYADYEKLPEGAPYQLIGGKLVMSPSPVTFHQRISRRIEFELVKFVEDRGLGEVFYAPIDVCLSDIDTYQPDIIFIAKERGYIIGQKNIEGAPDLVIEILSPSTECYDLRDKKAVYEKKGVKEYWIVDPSDKCIEVYENSGYGFKLIEKACCDGQIYSRLLHGFYVSLSEVFQ